MALTAQERTNIIKLTVAMFNAAPGATYLADLTVAYEANGRNLSQLARTLTDSAAYKAINPVFQTSAEFAVALLTPLGLQANTTAVDFVTAKFNAGVAKGQIAFDVAAALDATTDTQFADAKAILSNKATVAEYYSVTKAISQTNVGSLQQVVSAVTKDAASVTTAQGAIDSGSVGGSGSVFTLATAAETLTGTSANDTFNAADTTLTVADSIDGAAGTDTLNFTNATTAGALLPGANIKNIEIVNVRAVVNLGANAAESDLSTLAGLTTFNADRSTANVFTKNAGAGVQYGLIGDGATLFGTTEEFGYAASVTAAALNLQNGVKSAGATNVSIFGAAVTSTVVNSTGAANTLGTGTLTTAATSKATTINATTNLTTKLATTADTSLTITGAGTVDLSGAALNNTLTTINASAQTAGGVKVVAGNSTALKFTGGAGADTLTLGAVVGTGAAVDAGAGTDTLKVNDATYVTAATGGIIKNFEVVDIAAAITVDLDFLATNNPLTGLRVGAFTATASNINAATAANVTIYGNSTPTLNVKGATTPGQLDTVKIDVNDGAAAVNTITLTTPVLAAVETLQVVATDNVTITSLFSAQALTGITFSGAGAISLTTTAIALNPNVTVDASAATGNFTLDATGATGNGYTIKGSAGVNTLTGGNSPIAVDLTKSAAKADTVKITSAANSSANVLQTIAGFTNATGTGDTLNLDNTPVITANAAAAATGVANLSGAIASGIITFSGTAAATATLQNKIDGAGVLAGTTAWATVAFEHGGNTYVYESGDTTATFLAATDYVVQLTGVTGVTALSTAASGATTVFLA